ncbi:DUF1799 domain-containing protein [Epibacterium sp. DP7N7-1]|uniref:Uncharacterized protein n=1 Tax=Tritonibacter mobilis F1926 TaxID=1265309 RepID=A0A1B1A006_9RHOB|nr:DUF1799 domain-containing protein [Tritonibacter mobilis]ANP39893.1 hypothetical protein K529_003865 [Tritonibacter mobilis F1926]KJZ21823.1 phage protein [Tritonibacter mobilis]MBW3243163.1 DUF1799 domain-containing protein [Epibacterium sp. DP7N7-1]
MFGLRLNTAASAKDQDKAAIWGCNRPALLAFLAIQTQWRVLAQADGSRFWVGLDYAAAEPAFRLEGLTLTPTDWVGLRIIEDAARTALNER